MEKAKSKTSWACSRPVAVLFVVVLLGAATQILGSGGSSPCDDMDCVSFFDPALVLGTGDSPLFLSEVEYYSGPTGQSTAPKDVQAVNLGEWSAYFGEAVPRSLLSYLIYQMPQQELADLSASLSGKKVALSPDAILMRDAFVKYGKRDRVVRALEYIALAKQVEPIATPMEFTAWNTPKAAAPVSADTVKELMDTAESRVSRADKFLAQRYRFQALRLMYYSGQYPRAQQYYERYKGIFTEENSPRYRFIDIAAGAYYRDKKYGKANYLYSLVFDKFEPLKWSAYFSFHPQEDRDWKETLALTRNTHEREVIWQLLGICADGEAAIENIYAINPKSTLLPFLLVREVNKAERSWSGNQSRFANGVGDGNGPRPDAVVVRASRVEKIRQIADAGKAYKPYLWQLAAGHLLVLMGDSQSAERYIDLAEKSMPDEYGLQAQARLSRLFARVRALQGIDKSAEPFLVQEQSWLAGSTRRAGNLREWSLKHLSEIYAAGSDPVRSLMLTDSVQDPMYQSVAGIDRILAFMRSPANDFDRFLVKNYLYSPAELQELRGLNDLYAGNLANAVETFKTANAGTGFLKADPFVIHIRDCHGCDEYAPHTQYSKLSFAERMLNLSRVAQGQGQDAATASFELANGFYNMSFYGNSRDIYVTRHSNLLPRRPDFSLAGITINMDLAEKYYVQAAVLSSNREFKAKAIFMAAKSEQNRRNERPEQYFMQLRSFADTQYYREIIQECVRFKSYLGL